MADNVSLRGSIRGKLPRLKDKGKHKAKIMASREALRREENVDNIVRPNTAPTQFIENWNTATQAELESGKGGLLSSFKEKVQVIAQRQAQAHIEKELREANEFRTKVAASIDEKMLDYTVQMKAANLNIATVTAKLHHLSSNISEEKIKQLLAEIVRPYFEALSGDTVRRLDEMEERSNGNEMERTERLEGELESSRRRLSSLESTTRQTTENAEAKMEEIFTMATDSMTTTERQLSEVSSTFHDIKKFTESIPSLIHETQDSAETAAKALVQSAESVARQLIQQADDSNRAETEKLNRIRADEIRKVEQSLQSIGENVIQTVRADLGNLTKTVKSDIGYLTDSLVSTTTNEVDKVNHAVTRGKVHVEYIQDNIDKADRNLDRSFKNLALEVKQLNEDVTDTIRRTQEAEQKARVAVKDVESSMAGAQASIEMAESNLLNAKGSVERLNAKFTEDGAIMLENFENGFRNMKRDSGVFLEDYVERIEFNTTKASEVVASAFDNAIAQTGGSLDGYIEKMQDATSKSEENFRKTNRDSGIFLEDYLERFEEQTAKSYKTLDDCAQRIKHDTVEAGASMASHFSRFTAETGDSLNGYLDKVHDINAESEKEFRRVQRDSGVFFDDYLQKFEQSNVQAGETLSDYTQRIHRDTSKADATLSEFVRQIDRSTSSTGEILEHFTQKIERSTVKAGETLGEYAHMIEQSTTKAGETLHAYAKKIEDNTTKADKSVARVFGNMTKEMELCLDFYLNKFQGASSQAEGSIGSVFDRLAKEFEESLEANMSKIRKVSGEVEGTISSTFERLVQEIGASFETQVAKIQETSSQAEASLADTFERLEWKSVETLDARIAEMHNTCAQSEASLANAFERLTKETEESLDGHIEAIHSVTSQTNETVSSIKEGLENLKEDFVHSLDGCAEKIQDASAHAGEKVLSLDQGIERFRTEIEKHLDVHVEHIENANAQAGETLHRALEKWDGKMGAAAESLLQHLEVHGQTIRSVALTSKEEMVERYVSTLQTCNEEREAHAKELKLVDGRLNELDLMLNLIATEMGCSLDPFIQNDNLRLDSKLSMTLPVIENASNNGDTNIGLPDSPATKSGLYVCPNTTIKSRFDETSCRISEILDFCKNFCSQVNDISATLGNLPSGETFGTMLASNVRRADGLSKIIGVPANNSSLWSIIEGIEVSCKANGQAYERFDSIFQETRTFVSNANNALEYVPITLQEISTSATGITESVVESHTLAEESKTLTQSLTSNLRNTVQALMHCKGDFNILDKAIKESKNLAEEGKKSAEYGNAIVSEMQDVLLDTSKTVGEMANTTSGMSKSTEICKATVEGFKTEIDFFKDSVLTTRESIDGSLILTNLYRDEVESMGIELGTATQTMKHISESMGTLRDSVSGVGNSMDCTTGTARDTRKAIEDLNGSIGDAEFSIESFATSLTSFAETIKTADTIFADVSATVTETQENMNKLNEHIRSPDDLLEEMTASLVTLTEVAKATETSIVDTSTLLHDKSKELDVAKLSAPNASTHIEGSQSALGQDSTDTDKNLPVLPSPPTDTSRAQSPERVASTCEDPALDDEVEPTTSNGEALEVLLEPEASQDSASNRPSSDTNSPLRPDSILNKRRRLGDFFYIPQWFYAPATPTSGTSAITGLSRQEPVVDVLRNDRGSEVVYGRISDGLGEDAGDIVPQSSGSNEENHSPIQIQAQAQAQSSPQTQIQPTDHLISNQELESGEISQKHTPARSDSIDIIPTNISLSPNLHTAITVPATVQPTPPNTAILTTARGELVRRIENERVYVRDQYEGLSWGRGRDDVVRRGVMREEALMR